LKNHDTDFKPKRYLRWLLRQLPQRIRIYVSGASSLPQLKLDSSIRKSQITAFLGFEFHYRLDIIFDLESI